MSTDQNTQEPTLAMIMAKLEAMDKKLDATNSDLQAFKQKTAEDLECQERRINELASHQRAFPSQEWSYQTPALNRGNVPTVETTCARTEERPPVFNLPDDPFGRNTTTSKPPHKLEELPYYRKEQTNGKNAYSNVEEFLNTFERAMEADDISLDLYGPKWLLARLRLNTHIFMEKLQRLKLSPKDDIIAFTNTFDDLRKKAGQEPNTMYCQIIGLPNEEDFRNTPRQSELRRFPIVRFDTSHLTTGKRNRTITPGSTEPWMKYQKTPSRVGVQNALTRPRETLALPAPPSRQGQNNNQVVCHIKKEEPLEESKELEEHEIPIDEWEQDLGDDEDPISIKKIAIYGMAKTDNLWVIPITISTEEQSQEMNAELDTGAVMTCMAESAAKELKCTIIPKTGQIEFGINNLLKE
ncbi:hypothetical protein H4219_002896 [Mycoemilia scoparia]|uniref:Uncharacterized protein n=1 Tax=Mycoemilia scoparia TaxID=417184 RepID=A0A9W8A5P9_9FUNG|nr:hypothetical protein H4219_002896 [Mycoemilia scoparia]